MRYFSKNSSTGYLQIRKEIKGKYDVASTMNLLGALYSRMGKSREADTWLLESIALLKDENSYRKKDAYGYERYAGRRNAMLTILRKQNQYQFEKKEAELVLEMKRKFIQTLELSKQI